MPQAGSMLSASHVVTTSVGKTLMKNSWNKRISSVLVVVKADIFGFKMICLS